MASCVSFLLVFLLFVQNCRSDNSSDLSLFRVISAQHYLRLSIGPSSWKYIRVDVPEGFSSLRISLTQKKSSAPKNKPVVCFRYGGPPLPSIPVNGMEVERAILSAGRFRNTSNVGHCAWLVGNTTLNVSNEQIISGLLYLGLFSDLSPSRTQSKMISNGATYSFDVHFMILGCTDSLAGGAGCNRTIIPVLSIPTSNLSSSTRVNDSVKLGGVNGSWNGQCAYIQSFYVLSIEDFVSKLELAVEDTNNKNITCHIRYGALPGEKDILPVKANSTTFAIDAPRRGLWYIRIMAPSSYSGKFCFSLSWKIELCSPGFYGNNCKWPVTSLERVLSGASESPFDSRYSLPGILESGWFFWKLGNISSSSWSYFLLEVPNGAAGSVLSVEIRHSRLTSPYVYARFEGCPSLENWDFRHAKSGSYTFDLIYPVEGVWCIGVFHSSKPTDQNSKSLVSKNNCSTFCQLHRLDSDMEAEKFRMQLSLHGCANSCSDYGNCVSEYEASRLTFYSTCHCDRTHGGIDCSERIMKPSEHHLQIWALVVSNAAAILPSLWALRQKAFSEWFIYTTSGISSAVYHSCDAGGWCALPFDTLQFLDFWLSFLAVIFTCIYMAEVLGVMKATLHVGAAVVTAIIAKSDRTSGKNVAIVVGLGAVGLAFGLSLEFRRQSQLRSWRCIRVYQWSMLKISLIRDVGNLIRKVGNRFIWPYVGVGLVLVAFARLCWSLEQAKSYWIWHSLWHVSIYCAAFVLLFSVVAEEPLVSSSAIENDDAAGNDEERATAGERSAEIDFFVSEDEVVRPSH